MLSLSLKQLKIHTEQQCALCQALSCCMQAGVDINQLQYLLNTLLEQSETIDTTVLLLAHLEEQRGKLTFPLPLPHNDTAFQT